MMRTRTTAAVSCLCGVLLGCTELCVPTDTRLGFFSQGDCVLSKASFFQGHEWITFFGNEDLDRSERFPASELLEIAEGNRRVDWPLELLVELNASTVAYVNAITEYTERPENQKLHFLLTATNTSEEAVADSVAEIHRVSEEAVERWVSDRGRSLALMGVATHVIQDSFSFAHSVRDDRRGHCIMKVKAYIPRAESADNDGLAYHGGQEIDAIGHTTTEDSIYRNGRDCHDPRGRAAVEACLNQPATLARRATRDYLGMMHRAFGRSISDESNLSPAEILATDFADFTRAHLLLCEANENEEPRE